MIPSLAIQGLSRRYAGGSCGLHPVDLTLAEGDRLAILGPTGSGKSTLLRLICGLEPADAGTVSVQGRRVEDLPAHRRGVGLLAQRPALYPHLTVAENLNLIVTRSPRRTQFVEMLRLAPLMSRWPHELSGGERQRVALAKLFLRDVPVWLLDEPFNSLDVVFRAEFREDLHLLLEESPATIILVTHDPIDALALGRRLGVLESGRFLQLGSPEEVTSQPNHRFVAACLGQMNLIDGRVGDGEHTGRFQSVCNSVSCPLPNWIRKVTGPSDNLTLGIRPDDVLIGNPTLDSPWGTSHSGWPVISAEPVGSGWSVTLIRGRTRVRVAKPSGSPPPVGTRVDFSFPVDRCLWFEGHTGQRVSNPY